MTLVVPVAKNPQVSQKHDDGHFADGGDVDGSALLDVGVEVLEGRSQSNKLK